MTPEEQAQKALNDGIFERAKELGLLFMEIAEVSGEDNVTVITALAMCQVGMAKTYSNHNKDTFQLSMGLAWDMLEKQEPTQH